MPVEVQYGIPNPPEVSPSEYVMEMRRQLESAYNRVREQMGHVLDRQKEVYDRKTHGEPFQVGDLV